MRQLLLLAVVVLFSAPGANEVAAQSVMPSTARASGDTLLVRQLLTQGAAALRSQQWAEAVALFSSAYERADEDRRGDANFLWAYALYTQGSSIARENRSDDAIDAQRALEYFNESVARLQLHEHRNKRILAEAAEREIQSQETLLGRDP